MSLVCIQTHTSSSVKVFEECDHHRSHALVLLLLLLLRKHV